MKSIAQIVFGLPVEGPFDYKIPDDVSDLEIGCRVIVPFGRRSEMGYVVGFVDHSDFSSLKEIKKVLDDAPILSSELMQLAQWMADYYGCSLGEAIERMIPFSVRSRKKLGLSAAKSMKPSLGKEQSPLLFLSQDEERSLNELIRRSRDYLAKGQGVVFLAPDHTASQSIYERLSEQMGCRVARLDMGVSKKQTEDWVALKNGEVRCAVGLRSAVFAPVKNLGLVVILDEHQYGYKEDQMPFYHAREVILKRAEIERFKVVFVSSAPTAELWAKVVSSECRKIDFLKKDASEMNLIDLANYKPRKDSALSIPTANAVSQTLEKGGKVLVFFNRRGFHTLMKCSGCGHVLKCERCTTSFVYHDDVRQMVCPSCNTKQEANQKCPECNKSSWNRYGDGIEHVESDLKKYFPQARLATFDRETKRIPKAATMIIATQAVFKVLDQMDIDVAVVLDVDAELNRHDFRCHQKVFSLLMDLKKVVRTSVFVQTRHPNHLALQCARSMDLGKFYQQELAARKDLGFPPYQHLFEIVVRAKSEDAARQQADIIYEKFLEKSRQDFEIMSPQESFQAKLRDQYRYTIMGKSPKGTQAVFYIKGILKEAKKKRGAIVTINVDP